MAVSNQAFLTFRTCVIPEYLQHGLLALQERFRCVHEMNVVLSERRLVELLRLRQSRRGLGLFRLVQMDLSEQRGETFALESCSYKPAGDVRDSSPLKYGTLKRRNCGGFSERYLDLASAA